MINKVTMIQTSFRNEKLRRVISVGAESGNLKDRGERMNKQEEKVRKRKNKTKAQIIQQKSQEEEREHEEKRRKTRRKIRPSTRETEDLPTHPFPSGTRDTG